MKRLSLIAIAAAMLAACNNQQEQTISALRIDTDKVANSSTNTAPFSIPDTVDCIIDTTSIEFVILETTDDCLLGSASQIGYRGDTIIVFDKQAQSIFFFDSKGHYLSKIHRVGRSRTEYVKIDNLCYTNEEVIIYDWEGKIVAYGFDGKFRYSFEVPGAQSLYEKDGNILVSHGWNASEDTDWGRVSVYNKKGERLSTLLKIDEADANRPDWSDAKYLNGFGDSLFFMAPTDNVVYKYKNGDFVPAYQFDFGENNIPTEVAREGALSRNKKNYSYAYELRETERFRFAGINGANQKFLISWIFDKKENKVVTMSNSLVFKSIRIWPEIDRIDDSGNYISDYMSASAAKYLQAEDYKKLGDKSIWPKEVASLPDDDNGVIVRVRLKNLNDD